jgi:two-component system LytT family sensor kinase
MIAGVNRRLVMLAIAVWSVVAFWFASQAYFNPALEHRPLWSHVLAVNFTYYYLWALTTPLVIALGRRFPLARWRTSVPIHILASVVLTAVQIVIAELILLNMGNLVMRTGSLRDNLDIGFRANFHGSLPAYWLILAVWLAWSYARNAQRLETQLATAQLDALKMQLNPHFLFNTLNSVSALMYVDVDAADAMLARLSDFLRMTLERPIAPEIAFSEELDFVQRYLEIERIRFEERLRVIIDVERDAESALVPALILQPLVENAIHHGIARREAGGTIAIRASRDRDTLRITVRDDGGGTREVRERVGLSNTRARLHALYGTRYTLEYGPQSDGFEVEISIPCSVR